MNKISLAIIVVDIVAKSLEAYKVANARKEGATTKTNSNDLKWEAPKNDFVKVNWDVSLDKNSMKIEVGIIVIDGMREVFATLSSSRNHIVEPNIVKGLAALRTIHLCGELEFNRVILEGDALQMV